MAHRRIILLALCGLLGPASLWAQSDYPPPPVPLGDLARSLRKQNQPAAARPVIDNENLSQVMDEVESHRLPGSSMLFSFDGMGKTFKVSPSPDVTCSLSFNASATALISDPFAPRDLPDAELVKLDGPASISGEDLQVAVFNGTAWKIQEITVGLTIVRRSNSTAAYYRAAKLLPATADETAPAAEPGAKRSDVTLLYHIKGSALPSATSVFKTSLTIPLSPDQEWHWAIVQARGIPPN